MLENGSIESWNEFGSKGWAKIDITSNTSRSHCVETTLNMSCIKRTEQQRRQQHLIHMRHIHLVRLKHTNCQTWIFSVQWMYTYAHTTQQSVFFFCVVFDRCHYGWRSEGSFKKKWGFKFWFFIVGHIKSSACYLRHHRKFTGGRMWRGKMNCIANPLHGDDDGDDNDEGTKKKNECERILAQFTYTVHSLQRKKTPNHTHNLST